MLPTDQIKAKLATDDRYKKETEDFISQATAIFNDRYTRGNPKDTMIIHYLLYNPIADTYTKTIFVPPVVDITAVSYTIQCSIVGVIHPSYCVGYCLSTEAWGVKSEYVDGIPTDLSDHPNRVETIIHIIGGVLFNERVIVHELTRCEGENDGKVSKGKLTGTDVTGKACNFYNTAVKGLQEGVFGIDLISKDVFKE